MTRLPSRDALRRLAEIGHRYREAFDEVQAVLRSSELGPIPNWVFAIDPLPIEDIHEFSSELARAEVKRRKWKAALLAMTQLVALEDDGQELVGKAPPGASLDEVDASDEADLVKLDRFITVINAARAGGCIYVNGTFEPVERDAPPPDERDTFDFPPPRDAPHRE